jgi:hypothetical protein
MTSSKPFLFVTLSVVALLSASGCTLLWLFNNDPEGLPCDFSESKVGRCLEGYTCVGGACARAGEKVIGDPCARNEECGSGLACAVPDAFRSCEDDGDDVNCALLDEDELELRCRQTCETVDDTSCASGERCWLLSDVEGSDAICGGAFESGPTGICQERCAPLTCAPNTACTGCDGLDNLPDPGLNCIPQAFTAVNDFRFICDAAGSTPSFFECGAPGQDLCQLGSFCLQLLDGTGVCVPWCAVSGGNPECPAGSTCQAVDGTIGFCVQ